MWNHPLFYLCHILRKHKDFIKELGFVAEVDGNIVGSIMYSKSYLIDDNNNKVRIVSFGPLCVHPNYQRKGIGTLLIEKTRGLLKEMNIPAIVIYGDPHNYCKHGFKNGIDYKVSNMNGEYPLGLLVLKLKANFFSETKWKVQQSDVFKYDQSDVLAYDETFDKKEKKTQYSQELFRILIRSFLREIHLTTA